MKVAISSDFFTALSKLPKAGLNKTIKMVEKFKNDPKSPGLNYENYILHLICIQLELIKIIGV